MAILSLTTVAGAQTPAPLPGNPGNVFTAGQPVSVPLPASSGSHWRAMDYEGHVVAQGDASSGRANLGKLPVGFFHVTLDGAPGDVTLAVIAPLLAPTPANSPISANTEAGMWYKTPEEWKIIASHARLAGINWERDGFRWREMEPNQNSGIVDNKYDQEMSIMHDAGLHVLNLMMDIPGWSPHEGLHLPVDLRDVYKSFREIASRWRGVMDSMEPWNEGDIHCAAAEIASFQKAAYLGLKAGNPNIIVGSSSWSAAMVQAEVEEFDQNQVSPYFDTLNFHHYLPLDQLPAHYAAWGRFAHGKPFWVDEFNVNVPMVSDPSTGDPSPADMALQAQAVPKLYATTLYLNAKNGYIYDLVDYPENGRQFGMLRKDLTPRPGYVALAAVGRLLAGAKPIGQLRMPSANNAAVYAFRAVPDGVSMDVVVAWNDGGPTRIQLPMAPAAAYDHLGRRYPPSLTGPAIQLSPAPVFIVLPAGTVNAWASGQWGFGSRPILSAPMAAAAQVPQAPASPVVLQAVFPSEQMVMTKPHQGPPQASSSMEHISTKSNQQIQVFAYNFSNQPLTVNLAAQAPAEWNYSLPVTSMTLAPMARVAIPFEISPGMGTNGIPGAVQIRASGPHVGNSVLVFHLLP